MVQGYSADKEFLGC